MILDNDALLIHALRGKPFRHFTGLRGGCVLCRGSSAGTDDIGVRILLCTVQRNGQSLDQFLLHASVRLQLEPQNNNTQFIRVRQTVGQDVIMQRFAKFGRRPEIHDGLPACTGGSVHVGQFVQQIADPVSSLIPVRTVIHGNFLDGFLDTARINRFPACAVCASCKRKTDTQDNRNDPKAIFSPF